LRDRLIDVECKKNAINYRGDPKADDKQLNKTATIRFDIKHRLFLKKNNFVH
jgi:hypothetical protein